jgi:Putative metal-binding motif
MCPCVTSSQSVTPSQSDSCASGAESSNVTCHDGRDNDCDGVTDCDDANCIPFCGAGADAGRDACTPTGTENTNAACSDGRDNDCDGFIDCGASGTSADFDCTRTATVTVCPRDGGVPVDTGCVPRGVENTNAACSNGVDDDCDGYIDCGTSGTAPDFDCTRTATVTVCPRDGGAPVDTGCVPSGRENTLAACGNSVDEDCDGYTDCMDRDCSCVGACAAYRAGCVCRGAENTNATCTDGIDNDCDGFADCTGASTDFDCLASPAVTVCARDGG